jgi:hypothetical protein
MKHYPCFCGMCGKAHMYPLGSDEFRMLATLPGALGQDGRLSMACDECHPFTHSGILTPVQNEVFH